MTDFCGSEIESMGKESDEIQLVALSTYFEVNLKVVYVDQSPGNTPKVHNFDFAKSHPSISMTLLYRPGHYDILYQ